MPAYYGELQGKLTYTLNNSRVSQKPSRVHHRVKSQSTTSKNPSIKRFRNDQIPSYIFISLPHPNGRNNEVFFIIVTDTFPPSSSLPCRCCLQMMACLEIFSVEIRSCSQPWDLSGHEADDDGCKWEKNISNPNISIFLSFLYHAARNNALQILGKPASRNNSAEWAETWLRSTISRRILVLPILGAK